MSWDYQLAKKLKSIGGSGGASPSHLEGTIVSTSPLTVSLCGGEIMAPPMALDCVVCAQGFYRDRTTGHLYLETWKTGDRVVCAIVEQKAIILGKLGGTGWSIPVR